MLTIDIPFLFYAAYGNVSVIVVVACMKEPFMESSSALMKLWDVERQLGVSRQTLYRWCKAGTLEFVRLPSGYIRVPISEVERLKHSKQPVDTLNG